MSKKMILISSPDGVIARMLEDALDGAVFGIESVRPGPEFVKAARRKRPDIAILDRVHERPEVARMEIEVLGDAEPRVRIIAISDSSPSDAAIVESGLFYYMAQSPGAELVRVIQAAAKGKRMTGTGGPCKVHEPTKHTTYRPHEDDRKE